MSTSKKTPRKKTAAKKTPRRTKKKRAVKVTTGKTIRQVIAEKNEDKLFWPWPLRPKQQQAWEAMESGIDRFSLNWHRRFGKDVFGLSVARQKMQQRVGTYVHFFPKHQHARRALWRGIDPRKGAKFIDIAFGDIEVDRNNSDMFIEAYNGSAWNLLGSDNYDSSVVGGNIVGVVFSEWALCDPRAWEYISPILMENKGWAIFITTFRGRNHAWQMAKKNKDNPDWYVDIAGVDDTVDVEGNPIITPEDIEKERRAGKSESIIQQEYYCNPEATADGAIYGSEVEHLRNDARRNLAQWDPYRPVHCMWNIDAPVYGAYIMVQPANDWRHAQVIGSGTLEWMNVSQMIAHVNANRWPIHRHIIGAHQRELSQTFSNLGLFVEVATQPAEYITHTVTSNLINTMRVDGETCEELLDSLGGYVRRERFDPQTGDLSFTGDPIMSNHWRLAYPLELYANFDYSRGQDERSPPDYSQLDRAARVTRQ